jgi:integrase
MESEAAPNEEGEVTMTKPTPGITVRHERSCPVSTRPVKGESESSEERKARLEKARTARCTCTPTYQAVVWDRRHVDPDTGKKGKLIRRSFSTISAAKTWRQDSLPELRKGTMRAATQTTLRQAWETWYAGARDGTVRTRSGDTYKPSALRGYEQAMRLRILDDLGALRLSEVTRLHLQDVADRMLAAGVDPSTIRNTMLPMRAIYRRAISRGEVAVNPTSGLTLPAVRGRRERIAAPAHAAALIAAVPERDAPVWATALYAGLRLGELQALRDEDVDLPAGVILVERSWDAREGVVAPKSQAGRRKVPIVAALRVHLAAHKLRRKADGLFFGEGGQPFNRNALVKRAGKAWKNAGLEPIGLHQARHTCASIFIAAGVNVKALSSYLGHSSITITLDRYGHLMPGNEDEAVELVDGYLERAGAAAADV